MIAIGEGEPRQPDVPALPEYSPAISLQPGLAVKTKAKTNEDDQSLRAVVHLRSRGGLWRFKRPRNSWRPVDLIKIDLDPL